MVTEITSKPIYIVVSQTGTVLSRILKIITRKEYNHASISFEDDLNIMYSFGRKRPNNPFIAGFVTESASFGTFKRFSNTSIVVVKLSLNIEDYENLKSFINSMLMEPKKYGYNYLGLYLAALKIPFRCDNRYYCSEFVRDILVKNNVDGADKLSKIIHPMSFLNLPETKIVYRGKLKDYVA